MRRCPRLFLGAALVLGGRGDPREQDRELVACALAFAPRRIPDLCGVTLGLEGDANDFWGKGLSGGRLIVRQPPQATRA